MSKVAIFVAIACFFFCKNTAGAQQYPSSIPGVKIEADQFPTVVFVYTFMAPSDQIQHEACSGTLLSDLWVLTAAHCLLGSNGTVDPGNAHVYRGSNRLKGLTNPLAIDKIIICNTESSCQHSDAADTLGLNGDLALLRLSKPITPSVAAQIIHLQQETEGEYSQPGINVTSVGWGRTEPERQGCVKIEQQDATLNQVDLNLLDEGQCKQAYIDTTIDVIHRDTYCGDLRFNSTDKILKYFKGGNGTVPLLVSGSDTVKELEKQLFKSDLYKKLLRSEEYKNLTDEIFNQVRADADMLDFPPKYSLCAAKIGKSACYGDSGGPLIAAVKNQRRQIGVVRGEGGVPCADPNNRNLLVPSVYQHVAPYYTWIMSQINQH